MVHPLRVLVHIPLLTVILLVGCASPKAPRPAPDPAKEQIIILQKQLLELQNEQNETQRKVEEQAAVIDTLSSRVKNMDERQEPTARPVRTVQRYSSAKHSNHNAKVKKKRTKKKRSARRHVP